MKKSLFKKLTIGIFLFFAFVLLAGTFGKINLHAEPQPQHKHEFPGDTATYLPWNSSNNLPGTEGFYYLTKDVILDETWHSTTFLTTKICLNGHSIKLADSVNGNVIKVENSSSLHIVECSTQEHKYKIDENGLGIVDDTLPNDSPKIKGGYITGGHGVGTGGAIYVENGSIQLHNVNIIGNSTTGNGGALNISSSNPNSILIENTSFIGNVADGAAGGIYTGKNNQQIRIAGNSRISDNSSTNAPAGILVENQLNLGDKDVTSDIYIYGNKLKDNTDSDMSVTNKEIEVIGKFTDTSKIGFGQIKNGIFKNFYARNNPDKVNDMLVSHIGIPLGKSGNDAVYMYNAKDYSVTYDEDPHTFVPDSTFPVEYTIKYGTENGKYDLDTAPSFTDIGEYTIYYAVTVQSETIKGSQKITIADYAPEIKPYMPTPNKNMEYTGEAQELVTIPENSNATYRFKIKDGYWSEYTPKGLEIGVYTVFIKLQIDGNDIDEVFQVKASIIEADKTVLSDKIAEATEYADSIKADYKYIAQELSKDILSAKADVIISTKTKAEIAESTEILNQALELAKSNVKLVDDVKTAINSIGDVLYTEESKGKIDAARASYDGLYDRYKTLVTNYETLTNAEAKYASLKTDDEKAKAVISAIDSIGEITLDSRDKLNEVRNSYNALTDSQKSLVTNYEALENAENEYATLRANRDMAIPVEDAINAIGEVSYTEESKGKIDAARAAYDALTDPQKALVTNYETLTNAEARYAELVNNNNLALEVEGLINAIGEVTIESKTKIDAAREAYDALTEEQKPLVTNLNVLADAETSYALISLNKAKADAVDAKIVEIGDVTYTAECKEKIDAAKASYKVLTADQKTFVTKYEELENKEKTYLDVDYAYRVLNSIGAVELTVEYKEKIDAARNVYNALTDEEKALVTNSNKLTNAEAEYQKLSDEKTSTIIKIVAITGGVLLAAILIVIYILLFYVFNSWTLIKYKKKRVFKIGRKNGKMRLLCKNFRIIYRDEVNVFKNKD